MISSHGRTILGHDLAHCLTGHYLNSAPRKDWERIAYMVEDRLPLKAPLAKPAAETVVTARVAPALP
jgi:hypothetical protein